MAIDDSDRRRVMIVALLTLLALPALWWVNRDGDAAGPTVATAGVELAAPEEAGSTAPTIAVATTAPGPHLPPLEAVGDEAPVFLDGPAANSGRVVEIAVPGRSGDDVMIVEASFRNSMGNEDTCLITGMTTGASVTITNLDNDQSITCRVGLAPPTQDVGVVLHAARFRELADLTDAPIPVEIRR